MSLPEPDDAANRLPDPSIDAQMAASFADYLSYQKVLSILQGYGKGFQVTLIKGHASHSELPTYRVLIYKLKPKVDGQEQDHEYFEWQAEGIGMRFDTAVEVAHIRAQRHLGQEISF